jgi:Raf kinase inhibitor-like YbhB/YbcL family protein
MKTFLSPSLANVFCLAFTLGAACTPAAENDSPSTGGSSGSNTGGTKASGGSSGGNSGGSNGSSNTGGSTSGTGGGTGGTGSGGTGTGGSDSGGSGGSGTGGSSGAGGSTDSGAGGAGGSADAGGSTEGGGSGGPFTLGGDFAMMAMRNCFKSGNTKDTGNTSPEIHWSGVPADAMSLAISLFDTTNSNGHWVMWDIPATTTMLPPKLPKGVMPAAPAPTGSMQRGSSFAGGTTNPGFFGPGAGGAAHKYELTLWAIKTPKLTVKAEAVNDLIKTVLPAQSSAKVTLVVYGSTDAKCN